MKSRGVNVVLKGRKDDKYGYLKIAVRKGGKTIVYSLGVKVLKKDFNTRTQLLRASAPNSKSINELITTKVDSFSYKPYRSGKIKSICVFMQSIIDTTDVKSTKQKYENILNLFKEYLTVNYQKDDLYFEQIDNFVISGFRTFLLNKQRRNTINTASYKMKSFKSFFSKIKKQNIYHWPVDPFVSVSFKFEETRKERLSFDELKKLINTDFDDPRFRTSEIKYSLTDIKESFIFSVLAQGLRISDIMTLRWNDFIFDQKDFNSLNALIISKRMIKTKKLVYVFLDGFSSQFLINPIKRDIPEELFRKELKQLDLCLEDKKKIQDRIENVGFDAFIGDDVPGTWGENGFQPQIEAGVGNRKDDLVSNYIESKELDDLKNELEQVNFAIFLITSNLINFLSKDNFYKTRFVFPFLDNFLFKNIKEDNDFSHLTESQFLQFQGKRSYINRLTKELVLKKVSPSKKLSFHSARHTYTSLILEKDELGINIYDLMKSLGHTSILSTQKYIQGFNFKKISQLNSSLGKSLLQ